MKNYIYLIFFLFISCANVIPPDGGPKDLVPPSVISTTPKNPSIYFKNNIITLVFDEYIQLKNIENIKISPKCTPNPNIKLKGKQLEIKLNCVPENNTTYTINFGKSILDINEGNVLTNFKYVFSKESYLDSLFIRGNVKKLYFDESIDGALVGLSNKIDSLHPYYYTFSDQNGSFTLENIKDGNYLLFSFLDENNNFKYDEGELVAMPETITNLNLTKNLGLFYEQSSNLIKNVTSINKNTLLFEHEILEDSIIILNTFGFWNIGDKSSTFYFNKSPNFIKYRYQNIIDSIAISSPDSIQKITLKLISELNQIHEKRYLNIETSVPVKNLISENFTWELSHEIVNPKIISPFIIQIPVDSHFRKSQNLIINTNAVIGENEYTNDSTNFYVDYNREKYGSIKIKSIIPDTNLIIELFDNDDIIRKINLKDSVLIDWVPAGNYKLRLFVDKNQNNYWDSGNILNNKMSEKIIIYPDIIKIKSNWEIEVMLDTL